MPLMHPRRSVRRGWAGWLIVALLFVQVATAAYACPLLANLGRHDAAMSLDMPCAAMRGGDAMVDDARPGLCIEHCKAGNPAMEPAQGQAVPPPAWLPWFTVAPVLAEPSDPHVRAAAERRRSRAPPRPLSVVHCCYRI
ncbi:MAG TPA: hypothetical protein VLI72_14890 [Methylibium sp.]|nr:hypothetical protein [Methylibium sp.]